MGSCAIPLSIVNCDVSSRLKRSLIHGKKCVKLKWRPLTPLGIPVEPLVKETSHQGELNGGDLDAKVKLYTYGRTYVATHPMLIGHCVATNPTNYKTITTAVCCNVRCNKTLSL